MNFRITGLNPSIFSHLFGLPDDVLAHHNAVRYAVDEEYAFPCRIKLEDAAIGDSVLLMNYEHQPANNAYQSRHAIYVNEAATTAGVFINEIPVQMQRRLLSIRAFDAADAIIDADVIDGSDARTLIQRFLSTQETTYLHVHFARRGCFAARVDRNY
jgi:Protein of unknown function (DUF1203)